MVPELTPGRENRHDGRQATSETEGRRRLSAARARRRRRAEASVPGVGGYTVLPLMLANIWASCVKIYGNFLYYFCNFSVSLKLFQYKKLKRGQLAKWQFCSLKIEISEIANE